MLYSKILNDADAMITVLGDRSPKLKFIVKGIKKSKKRPIASCEIGSLISLDYYFHGERDFYNVKEINLIERFDYAKSSYLEYLLINYFCELLNIFLTEGEIHERGFKIAYACFNILNRKEYHPILLPYFKVKLLMELGLISYELVCHECGREYRETSGVHLNPYTLEIICRSCNNYIQENTQVVNFIDLAIHGKYAILKDMNIHSSLLIEADHLLNLYIRAYIHRDIKSEQVLYTHLRGKDEFRS
ncbi:MAG: DNA repair protein RecO [Leptospiraceae bacterium]|nr:DNA repair protein RecO [Leptospiraceae bacterium]